MRQRIPEALVKMLKGGIRPIYREEAVELPETDRECNACREPCHDQSRHEAHESPSPEDAQHQQQRARHRGQGGQRLGAVLQDDMAQNR